MVNESDDITFDSSKNPVEQTESTYLEKIRSKVKPLPIKSYAQRLGKKFKSAIPEVKTEIVTTAKEVYNDIGEELGVGDMTRWGYHKRGSHGLPTMGTIAFGSLNPPYDMRNQRPFFGSFRGGAGGSSSPKKPKRQIVSESDYQNMLTSGYTESDLRSQGIESKQSRQYQIQSPFGRSVAPYRPISYGQCFYHMNPKQQEYQKQTANVVMELYNPEFLGKNQAMFSPPILRW